MGILRDVLDTVKDLKSFGNAEDYLRRKRYSSLSKRSLEGTLQFPVLVSKSMDIDTLQTVTKALERQFASFVQITFTMSPTLNLDNEKDAIGFLRKFHQNSGVKTDFRDLVNTGSDFLEENYSITHGEDGTVHFSCVYEGSSAYIQFDNKEQMVSLMDFVREGSLNDIYVPKPPRYRFQDPNLNSHYNGEVLIEAPTAAELRAARNTLRSGGVKDPSDQDVIRYASDAERSTNQRNQDRLDGRRHSEKMDLENRKLANQQSNSGRNSGRNDFPKARDAQLVPDNILRDNEARKANELVPTTMHIRTITINDEGEQQGYLDFIIGVKATMHPIPSEEVITNLVNASKSGSKFFNFIKWTSGEIAFFKDFVFGIKEIKDDVVDRSSGSSPWWIALKRRRALAKLKDSVLLPNQILPNASIVVSMEEVDYIKSTHGFDLMNPGYVDSIMRRYFLIAFVVVDNSSQITHFMFDGQTAYQTITFSGLEKENSNKANDFKEMLKLINRV